MPESLLACVIDDANGIAIVRRSVELAKMQGARLVVLVCDTRGEDYEKDHAASVRFYSSQLAVVGGETRSVRSDSPTEIADALRAIASRNQATQIIVGDDNESALSRLFGWTTPRFVMRYLPGIDLHIIGSCSEAANNGNYEPAVPASLSEQSDGTRRLQLDPAHDQPAGLFFRESATEFDHGYFLHETRDGDQVVLIRNGVAEDP